MVTETAPDGPIVGDYLHSLFEITPFFRVRAQNVSKRTFYANF
jgi:hypothetical protein